MKNVKNFYLKSFLFIMVFWLPTIIFGTNPEPRVTPGPGVAVQHCTTAKWSVGNGYTAETWFDKGIKGSACLTTYDSTSFLIDWDLTVYGFLHEVGLYNLSKRVDSMNVNAIATHSHTFGKFTGAGGFTGLYGWFVISGTRDRIEFYINEDWCGNPFPGEIGDCIYKGTITVDGGTYDIYTRPKNGTKGTQWWSNRTSPRSGGTISYVKHFQAWRSFGMPDATLIRLTFAFECTWGFATGGSLKYSSYTINKP